MSTRKRMIVYSGAGMYFGGGLRKMVQSHWIKNKPAEPFPSMTKKDLIDYTLANFKGARMFITQEPRRPRISRSRYKSALRGYGVGFVRTTRRQVNRARDGLRLVQERAAAQTAATIQATAQSVEARLRAIQWAAIPPPIITEPPEELWTVDEDNPEEP